MYEVKQEFLKRKDEVNVFFNLLDDISLRDAKLIIDNELPKRPSVELSSTLKSSGMLILYNLVESTITNLIDVIHQTFSDESLKYKELNENIQLLWFSYYYNNIKEGNINNNNLSKDLLCLNQIVNYPSRINCALLPWQTANDLIRNHIDE